MPNRILREGILESSKINALGLEAELFYRRLMSVVDDYGRFHAEPVLLRSKCYPRRIDQITDKKVAGYLAECAAAGVLLVYEIEGEKYLELCKFHQHVRAKHSKFPQPPADAEQMQRICIANARPNVVEDVDVDVVDQKGNKPESMVKGSKTNDVFPDVLNTEEFKKAWESYHSYRAAMRLPRLLPISRNNQLRRMAEWGHQSALSSISDTIANGYQGLFPPKKGNNATNSHRPKGHTGINTSAGY